MKNEGLMTILVIDEHFIEHQQDLVNELLHLVAKALGTGLTSKLCSEHGWFEYELKPSQYQIDAIQELRRLALSSDNPNLDKERAR